MTNRIVNLESPRIHKALKQQGIRCSLARVKRLMRKAGLYALQTRKHTPKQEKLGSLETKNLLLGKAKPTAIDLVWHSDMTYVPTDAGWLYLAGVIDGFSKRMVGYAMAERMKTELVLEALRSALLRRKPAKGLIHHSDKGSPDTSYLYQHALHHNHMLASLTGTGACFDNAFIAFG